jgi:peptidoglycan LD-endopeptidase CwlK
MWRAPNLGLPGIGSSLGATPVVFSQQSDANLRGVNPTLDAILRETERRALDAGIKLEVSEGLRGPDRQRALVEQGKSQTLNSRHLTGNAVDLHIVGPDGKPNWNFESYRPVADIAKQVAEEMGVKDFVWGGDWTTLKDGVHFQVGGAHQALADDTLATLGKPPIRGTGMINNNQPPQSPAQAPAKPSFWDKLGPLSDPDRRARLAIALEGMTLNPNKGLIESAQAGIESRRETASMNRTAEWLRLQGHGDLADAMMTGALDAKTALGLAKPKEKDQTAMIQNYEYAKANGFDGTFADFMRSGGAGGTTVNLPGDPVKVLPDGSVLVVDPAAPDGFRVVQPPGSKAATETEVKTAQNTASLESVTDTIALIDSIATDPALPSITGMIQGRLPAMTQAGTNLSVKIEQLQGQAFLRAFESLRGGGSITEREGLAAQNAMARLQRVQDDASYRESLLELKTILDRGRQRALAGVKAQDGDSFSGGGTDGGIQVGDPY